MTQTTRTTPQRITEEARKLADELERGEGPALGRGQLIYGDDRPCCALGHLFSRAGLDNPAVRQGKALQALSDALSVSRSGAVVSAAELVIGANDGTRGSANRARSVVTPLRNLAAALESEAL